MTKGNMGVDNGWGVAISKMQLAEIPTYVKKENGGEDWYRVVSIAQDFFNPEERIVTFYKLRDENEVTYSLNLVKFHETFELIQAGGVKS